MGYITVNQHKPQYSLWYTNDDTCLLLAIMHNGAKGIGGGSSSQMSPDFLPQDWLDVYGDAVVNDMHNVMLFRGSVLWWFHYGPGWHCFHSGSMNDSMYVKAVLLNYAVPYMPFVSA